MDRIDREEAKRLYTAAAMDRAIENVQHGALAVAAYYDALIEADMDEEDAMDLTRDWHSIYWTSYFANHYLSLQGKE